ncbi:TetR/AcrR family transcriptional regulator [Kinneretia asaccharophila]|uniref:TetR family transcriptional regulator n=1 Tax=Roseateles asaccharophilus TaxID=582607 RepID=A0A4R6NBJ2_9BURK|nr:TetR/AcrR family transcriptional regulator [Roseateles asaccharophilus]MDN3542938.1 TetR/AcrR family transcriptional regulator [Roseateles asaccharophilus]TDP13362.1 TetR family transcriptional regulator [Roseateles asaccharophilus]
MARTINPDEYDARYRALLEAAKVCFARKGFHRTSTAEICAELGVSSGSLFHYFPNKKALISAIVEQEGLETAQYLDGLQAQPDLAAALRDFVDLVISLASDASFGRLALEIAAEAARDAEIGALVARNDAELRRRLALLVGEARARGQIAPTSTPAAVAQGIAALIDGIFSRVAMDPQFRPSKLRPVFQQMLAGMLQPSGASP